MRSKTSTRRGFTLLEMILTVVIISTVAAVSLQYLRPTGEASRQRSCDLARQMLQNYADRYYTQTGNWPSNNLSEIAKANYAGDSLPVCPCQGGNYQMSGAIVICPTHEATRK